MYSRDRKRVMPRNRRNFSFLDKSKKIQNEKTSKYDGSDARGVKGVDGPLIEGAYAIRNEKNG